MTKDYLKAEDNKEDGQKLFIDIEEFSAGELSAKLLEGAGHLLLHRFYRYSKTLGDLLIMEPLFPAQREDFLATGRKGVYYPVQFTVKV